MMIKKLKQKSKIKVIIIFYIIIINLGLDNKFNIDDEVIFESFYEFGNFELKINGKNQKDSTEYLDILD